jgi:hypothetical protein
MPCSLVWKRWGNDSWVLKLFIDVDLVFPYNLDSDILPDDLSNDFGKVENFLRKKDPIIYP